MVNDSAGLLVLVSDVDLYQGKALGVLDVGV
jgi:hypothetical protein